MSIDNPKSLFCKELRLNLGLVFCIERGLGVSESPHHTIIPTLDGFACIKIQNFIFSFGNLPPGPFRPKDFFRISGFFWPEGGSGGYNNRVEGEVKAGKRNVSC